MLARMHTCTPVRQAYWDPVVDKDLYDDKIALNLIFIQAVADMKQVCLNVSYPCPAHVPGACVCAWRLNMHALTAGFRLQHPLIICP